MCILKPLKRLIGVMIVIIVTLVLLPVQWCFWIFTGKWNKKVLNFMIYVFDKCMEEGKKK